MKNFVLNLSVITAIAGISTFFASQYYPKVDFTVATYLCIYFFLITCLAHFSNIRSVPVPSDSSSGNQNNKFVSRYLLTTVSKFFLSVLILVGYVFLNSGSAVPFIILFAAYYFLFTTFEIFSLVKYFRGGK